MAVCPSRQTKSFGLFVRRERWGLSKRGWLVAVLSVTALIYFGFTHVFGFLAVHQRTDTDILVVEGWVKDYAVQEAVKEWNSGRYSTVYTTGGPASGLGGYVNDFQTSASVGADSLKRMGVPADRVQMVPCRVMDRDRTYSSAVALRDWFKEHGVNVTALNVVTEDLHARRTRLLYQKAFGDHMAIGVLPVHNPDYDSNHWWRYSEGVKEIISEGAAYIYARLFFFPQSNQR